MTTITIKTADLIGPALDLAVATAVGFEAFELGGKCYQGCGDNWSRAALAPWSPSTDWAHGGPLIEKHSIAVGVLPQHPGIWCADFPTRPALKAAFGNSALIAACRAIVAAKLGDEVQVPAELVQEVQNGLG